MNEQLQKVLAELFSKASGSVGSIIDFGKEEIPELVREFLYYNAFQSLFVTFVTVIVSYFIIRTCTRYVSQIASAQRAASEAYKNNEAWTRYRENSQHPSIEYLSIMETSIKPWFFVLVRGIVYVIATSIVVVEMKTALMIVIAPRLYLVQMAMDMYKSVSQ